MKSSKLNNYTTETWWTQVFFSPSFLSFKKKKSLFFWIFLWIFLIIFLWLIVSFMVPKEPYSHRKSFEGGTWLDSLKKNPLDNPHMSVLPRRVALLRSAGVSWEEPDLTLLRREEALCCLFVCLFLFVSIWLLKAFVKFFLLTIILFILKLIFQWILLYKSTHILKFIIHQFF